MTGSPVWISCGDNNNSQHVFDSDAFMTMIETSQTILNPLSRTPILNRHVSPCPNYLTLLEEVAATIEYTPEHSMALKATQ